MNTPNNKRRKDSQRRIEEAFVMLIQENELKKITVTDICNIANVNRTTFYANYVDIYDLAEKIVDKLEYDVFGLYDYEVTHKYNSNNYLKLFKHIYENRLMYKTYFKLGGDVKYEAKKYDTEQAEKLYGGKYIDYHIEFFKNGLTAIIKKWLDGECKETPEEFAEILKDEYSPKEMI